MTPPVALLHANRVASRWANGGGVTYQVLAGPEGAGMEDFDWRVSFAEVASEGAFSRFPGVDRVLVLTRGRGMVLEVDGQPMDVRRFEPVHFPGEVGVRSRLTHGPTEDLNIMTRRGRVDATVGIITMREGLEFPAPGAIEIIAVLEGNCALVAYPELPLGPRDCLLLRDGLALQGRATLARIRLRQLAAN